MDAHPAEFGGIPNFQVSELFCLIQMDVRPPNFVGKWKVLYNRSTYYYTLFCILIIYIYFLTKNMWAILNMGGYLKITMLIRRPVIGFWGTWFPNELIIYINIRIYDYMHKETCVYCTHSINVPVDKHAKETYAICVYIYI